MFHNAENKLCNSQGRIQDFKRGGHNTLFFSDRRAASLESRASPKKADERRGEGGGGGGGGSVESRASPKPGGVT